MTDDNAGQLERDKALRAIEIQMEKGAMILESIQSDLKKASLLDKSQDAEQFEYGEAGRLIAAMWEQDKERWRRQAGIADERDEEQKRQFLVVQKNYKDWRAETEDLLRYGLFETEDAYNEFAPEFDEYGFANAPYTLEVLQNDLHRDLDRLRRIYQKAEQGGFPVEAPQPPPSEDEGGKKRGPTVRTQIRAEVSKRLKDAHPEWTQKRVATVFISYSHADSQFVDWLADKLKASGVDVWIDKWMIKVGDSITQKINEGISDSDFLIVVLSRVSVNSNWVREELNAATIRNIEEEKHAFILPVLIEDCNIPTLLQHRKYADFKDDPEQVFRELLEAIQARESTSTSMPTERRSSRFRFLPRKRLSLEQWAAIAAIIATLIATVALLRDVLDFTWPKQNSSPQVQLTSTVVPAVRRTTAPPIVTVTPALTNQSSNVEPDTIGDIFPMFIGSTWSYSFGKVTQATDEQGSRILQSIGSYTETVVTIETGLSDKAKIIGVEITGENFMNHCAGDDFMSGDLDTWYVLDDSRLFQLCSRDEASTVATEMVHGQTQATSSVLPEYVAPFEVGKLWPAFPDIPPREDTCYQWHVESKVDVSVPAGEFKDCYRLLLYTMPDTTIRWVCPGVGLVAAEYHHHGSIEEYRAELKSFQSPP